VKGWFIALAIIVASLAAAHFGSPRREAHAADGSSSLTSQQLCTQLSDRITVIFNWTPSGHGPQWLDLSLANNGFVPGTFVNAGPLDGRESSFTWQGLLPGATHFIRLNTLTPQGWQPSPTYTFVTGVCHVPASPPILVEQHCSTAMPGRVVVTLKWAVGDAGPEWVDLSLFDNNFAAETFIGSGPLASGQSALVWDGLAERATHFVRVNTLTSIGWRPSPATSFTTIDCESPVLTNAPTFQRIPTYDGSGQAEHPDIVYFPAGWHGYKYWMAFTPYPFGNNRRENPSIVVSNDGTVWLVPPGLTNPLVPAPACDHNSDPDLVYHPETDELYLYYTEQQRSPYCGALNDNHLRLLKSRDGVHWSRPQTVISWDLGKNPLYLSPGVVYRGGSFELWIAGAGGVVHATSSDGVNWSALEPVHINATPWHLDVHYIEGRSPYWMLFVDSPLAGSKLKLATSKDGLNWEVYPEPLLVPGLGWDDERIYRATFLYGDDGRFRVWYSARSRLGQWHVGYAETGQSSLFDSPGD
jgi:hypothetical protein